MRRNYTTIFVKFYFTLDIHLACVSRYALGIINLARVKISFKNAFNDSGTSGFDVNQKLRPI